jgi:hypothetical protein
LPAITLEYTPPTWLVPFAIITSVIAIVIFVIPFVHAKR